MRHSGLLLQGAVSNHTGAAACQGILQIADGNLPTFLQKSHTADLVFLEFSLVPAAIVDTILLRFVSHIYQLLQ